MAFYSIPEKIVTSRLILRTSKTEDWRDMHAYYSDEISTKYTLGRALSEGENWQTMASMVGHWQLLGYGPYAVEAKSTGRVLGTVGLWYPKDWPEPEIKWALARCYWAKGFASETAAVKKMVEKHLPQISLISFMHSENITSKRVAMAVGAVFEKEVAFRNGTWHIYRYQS